MHFDTLVRTDCSIDYHEPRDKFLHPLLSASVHASPEPGLFLFSVLSFETSIRAISCADLFSSSLAGCNDFVTLATMAPRKEKSEKASSDQGEDSSLTSVDLH